MTPSFWLGRKDSGLQVPYPSSNPILMAKMEGVRMAFKVIPKYDPYEFSAQFISGLSLEP